jgi:hypothetical protein
MSTQSTTVIMNLAHVICYVAVVTHIVACSSSPSSTKNASADAEVSDARAADASGGDSVTTKVPLPDGPPGIGFDDLQWAPGLGKIVAPAGRTGNVDLVDPNTLAVNAIGGFSKSATHAPGARSAGSTSAVEGGGFLFALDHETATLRVIDPATGSVLFTAKPVTGPDYVRYVAKTKELWLTEPLVGLEAFSLSASGKPTHSLSIPIAGGPEGLVIDEARGRAYTNSFTGSTFAIDIATHSVVETWPNGCSLSLGLALDAKRGFVFVACKAGSVVALDVNSAGKQVGKLKQGSGLDIISYDPTLHHLYVQGSSSADLGIVAVASTGELTLLGVVPTAASSTSAADGHGNVFVGDPENGGLIRVRDTYPATP